MNEIEYNQLGLKELAISDIKDTNGGAWYIFVAGAIAGGLLYDAWKTSLTGYVNGCMNGSVDAAIRPSR